MSFSTENKELHYNLKRADIITYMKVVAPFNTSLFTQKFERFAKT